jgi:adenylate cyclase, class 2
MPIETEVKVKVASHDAIRARLRDAGAAHYATVLEVNTFFDTADRALLAAGSGVRVRHQRDVQTLQEKATLTYKGPLLPGAVKRRDEAEIVIDDHKTAERILRGLGYLPTLSFEKRRETWLLDRCHVELDEVPHLGCFVEIEGPDEATIQRLHDRLSLHGKSIKSSYAALLVDHLDQHGLPRDAVWFEPARLNDPR